MKGENSTMEVKNDKKYAPSLREIFLNGILKENPILRLALALCPSLAVSTTAINGLGMGLCVLFVMTGTNVVVSIFRKVIHPKIRIPAYLAIIATLVTIVESILHAYFPQLYEALGMFIALIVVFAIILARAEVFASKHTIIPSFIDGVSMGIGFTASMFLIGSIREILGAGTILGESILGPNYQPVVIMLLSPGAFLIVGILMGFFNWLERRLQTSRCNYS